MVERCSGGIASQPLSNGLTPRVEAASGRNDLSLPLPLPLGNIPTPSRGSEPLKCDSRVAGYNQGTRILLAEDNPINALRLVVLILTKRGPLDLRLNGRRGLDSAACERSTHRHDLQMPEMTA